MHMRVGFAVWAVFRVRIAATLVHRAELIFWAVSGTLPLLMLAVWLAADEAGGLVGATGHRWDSDRLVSYFGAALIAQQALTLSTAYDISYEIRDGRVDRRLLAPLSPLVYYFSSSLAAVPFRLAFPLVIFVGSHIWRPSIPIPSVQNVLLFAMSMAGAWVLTLLVHMIVGALSFFFRGSVRLLDLYVAAFLLFSGTLFPLDLVPVELAEIGRFLPFRYQAAAPIGLLTEQSSMGAFGAIVLGQLWWMVVLAGLLALVWRQGVRRHAADGG